MKYIVVTKAIELSFLKNIFIYWWVIDNVYCKILIVFKIPRLHKLIKWSNLIRFTLGEFNAVIMFFNGHKYNGNEMYLNNSKISNNIPLNYENINNLFLLN